MAKCFEVKFLDMQGNIYTQRLCCKDTTLLHVIHAAAACYSCSLEESL